MTLFVLVSLSGVIKFVDQVRKVGQGDYSALSAGIFSLLSMPKDIDTFAPMGVLLGSLFGLGQLAIRSELVAMQSSGFTRMQIAGAAMKTAIPLVLFTMIIGEWVVPRSDQMACNFRAKQIYGGSVLSTKNGLWAKDGNDFVYIERVFSERELYGVHLYYFNNHRRLDKMLYAAIATFKDGVWKLLQVETYDLTNEKQVMGSKALSGEWKTNLTPEKLGVVAINPTSLSISGLHNYIKYLQHSGQESGQYEVNMWKKIFSPFSVVVMMLLALSFIFGPLCILPMGIQVMTGISLSFLFYVLDQIFGQLSIVYSIPPVLGALLPSMIFLLSSMYMLLKRK